MLQLNKLITVVLFPVHKGTKSFCSEEPGECHCAEAFLTTVLPATESPVQDPSAGSRGSQRLLCSPGGPRVASKGPAQACSHDAGFSW